MQKRSGGKALRRANGIPKSKRLRDMLTVAQQEGLLSGGSTKMFHGRMPEALVNKAKARTGIKSDTDLLRLALVNIAVADDYTEWLFSRKGTVDPGIDLEF